MDTQSILDQITDVPATFKSTDPTYQYIANALTIGMRGLADTYHNLVNQMFFNNPSSSWLQYWGELLGIPELAGEEDGVYATRIMNELTAWVGTANGILLILQEVYGITATISENLTSGGYTIGFTIPLSSSQLDNITSTLARIRPAGVPFNYNIIQAGAFLGATSYTRMRYSSGAFLSGASSTISPGSPINTNSIISNISLSFFNIPSSMGT